MSAKSKHLRALPWMSHRHWRSFGLRYIFMVSLICLRLYLQCTHHYASPRWHKPHPTYERANRDGRSLTTLLRAPAARAPHALRRVRRSRKQQGFPPNLILAHSAPLCTNESVACTALPASLSSNAGGASRKNRFLKGSCAVSSVWNTMTADYYLAFHWAGRPEQDRICLQRSESTSITGR